jgi:hypothetical protein
MNIVVDREKDNLSAREVNKHSGLKEREINVLQEMREV